MSGFKKHEQSGLYYSADQGGIYWDPAKNDYYSVRLNAWLSQPSGVPRPIPANDLGDDIGKGLLAVFTGGASLAVPELQPGGGAPAPQSVMVSAPDGTAPPGYSPPWQGLSEPMERNYTRGYQDGVTSRGGSAAAPVQEGVSFDTGYSAAYFEGYLDGRNAITPRYQNTVTSNAFAAASRQPAVWQQPRTAPMPWGAVPNGWANSADRPRPPKLRTVQEIAQFLESHAEPGQPDANRVMSDYLRLPVGERMRFFIMLDEVEEGFSLDYLKHVTVDANAAGIDTYSQRAFKPWLRKYPSAPTSAANGDEWYDDILGGVHLAAGTVLRVFGLGTATDQLEKLEGDELPTWARTAKPASSSGSAPQPSKPAATKPKVPGAAPAGKVLGKGAPTLAKKPSAPAPQTSPDQGGTPSKAEEPLALDDRGTEQEADLDDDLAALDDDTSDDSIDSDDVVDSGDEQVDDSPADGVRAASPRARGRILGRSRSANADADPEASQAPDPETEAADPKEYDGMLVKDANAPQVYKVERGKKHWITTPKVFDDMGFKWEDVSVISALALANIPSGTPLA